MAIHHPTPPFSGGERPRLPSERGITEIVIPSAQVGPVTQAIRAMRAAEHCTPGVQHADQAIANIESGLASFFAETNAVKSGIADPVKVGDRYPTFGRSTFVHGIHALSRTEVENLVEGLVDLLDGWDRDTDHEPDLDSESDEQDGCATEWAGRGAHRFNVGRAA